MALTMYAITGDLKDQLGGESIIGDVTLTPYATTDAIVDGADVRLGSVNYDIATLPASVSLSAGPWWAIIQPRGKVNGNPQFRPLQVTFDLQADTTWGAIVSGALGPVVELTPTVDSAVAGVIGTGGQTDQALSATYARKGEGGGKGVSRVLTKLQTGEGVTIAYVGDSGLAGGTATTGSDAASRVKTTLDARFGVTTTKSNHAVSGYRAYSALNPGEVTPTKYASARAADADLYVIAFGHNDLRSTDSAGATLTSNGYPLDGFKAAVEHMVRRLRVERPGADILISNEWPYTGPSESSNVRLAYYNAALQQIAAHYGCAFVDYYGTLVALGATGSNAAVDDLYIHPTGQTGAQHPNDEGHRVWAEAITDLLPADVQPAPEYPSLPGPAFGAERYTHAAWQTLAPGSSDSRTLGEDGVRLVNTWTGTVGTFPRTSTVAGAQLEVQATGSEVAFMLDTGAGQGVVKIEVNGALVNSALDLSTLSGTQSRIPLTGLGVGVHRIVVTLVSGSVTCRGIEFLPAIAQRIKYTSGLIAYTGTFSNTAATQSYEGTVKTTTTAGDTVTVEWVGTALWLNGYRYGSTTHRVGIATDGGTEEVRDLGIAGGASQYGGWLVSSGLPYGRHTTVLRVDQQGRSLAVSTFLAFDEQRTERPDRMAGTIVAGDALAIPTPLPSTPTVRIAPADATSAVPPYPSSVTTSGFTANGTAAAKLAYELTTGRVAY